MTAIYLNDYNPRRLGYVVERVEGWADVAALQPTAQDVPGRAGELALTGALGTMSPRTVTVYGTLLAASAAALVAARRDLIERASRGLIELRTVDAPDVMHQGILTGLVTAAYDRQFRAVGRKGERVTLTFTCLDPRAYSTAPTVVALATTRAPCPLGSAPVAPLVRIFGAATNPVLTYRGISGVVRQSLGFTLTLAAADFLEIDCEAKTVTKSVSGVVSNAIDTLSSGDFPTLDPGDGDYGASAWPTLELSAGAGEVAYRKAWA